MRTVPVRPLVLVIVTGNVLAGVPGRATTQTADPGVPPADHHVHVWSPAAAAAKLRIQREVLGREPGPEDVRTGDEVVSALNAAGIQRGVLLSAAYFFGIPDLEFDDAAARARAENEWVAKQAARHPDRLVAFFSANPLAPYAVDELDRCAVTTECLGFKLQLANSDVDFRDSADVRRLARFFAAADERDVPLLVHLQTRDPDFGAPDVNAFVDRVLPSAPDIPIQVAHLGGDSQYDDPTRRSIAAFLSAFRDHPQRTANIFFDLALVPLPETLARGDSTLVARIRAMNAAFAEVVREIGPDRIVFGSDYPEIDPAAYLAGIRRALPLDSAEFRDLTDDPAPYLR